MYWDIHYIIIEADILLEVGLLGEDVDGGVEDGVAGAVLLVHVNAYVGCYAKLGKPSLGVHDGARREAHTPAVGQSRKCGRSP